MCFYTFLACCSFNLASAQTAPKNPNTFTLQEIIDRPTVGWTSKCEYNRTYGYGGSEKVLSTPMQIATQKFVKGKKIYTKNAQPLDVMALQKMRFVSEISTSFDPEDFAEVLYASFEEQPGFIVFFDVEGLFFYDKVQNSIGFAADKIYLTNDTKQWVCIENAIVNYKERPQHLTPLKMNADIYFGNDNQIIADYAMEHLRKKSAGVKKISRKNASIKTAMNDADMLQYESFSPEKLKCELYWDETTQQFGLFVETFNFQMRHKDNFVTDYEFQKPAAH